MEEMKEKYENFKEQVRAQADIVRVVSDYVPLKKKGGRYWGCCPFHGKRRLLLLQMKAKGYSIALVVVQAGMFLLLL